MSFKCLFVSLLIDTDILTRRIKGRKDVDLSCILGAPSAGKKVLSSSTSPDVDMEEEEEEEDEEENDAPFHELLKIWFPNDGKLPKAYLVGTRDEALLIYDWIKLRMLRSEVDRLVDVALIDLEASQLIIFVQSFGIPVKCMTRLLKALDKECRQNPDSLEIQDKIYLIQVIGF